LIAFFFSGRFSVIVTTPPARSMRMVSTAATILRGIGFNPFRQQRRRTGDIAPRHRFAGRKPMIVASHQGQMRTLLAKKNDLTLKELRQATGLKCSLQAINVVLAKMGLTYKKRHSAPASKTVQTSHGHVVAGRNSRRALTRPS
jgi:transposase